MLLCASNNKRCNEMVTVVETLSQEYGRCYSVIQNSSVRASGHTYGLQILFNLELYESMGLYVPTSGLKLYLTSQGLSDENSAFVDLSSEVNLPPGFDHSLIVHLKLLSKLSHPYSDCETYGKGRLWRFNTKKKVKLFVF